MGYHFMNIEQMKKLDLFDDIPYKYIKNIINEDEETIDVVIEHLDCDIIAYCKTRFTFEISQGKTYKKFVVEKEYNGSSAFALLMCGLDDELDDGEAESEEEEEEEEDDWKYLCPNLHWGGQYGCDLCCYDGYIKDIDNQEMKADWLNSKGIYCYKLHKKWLQDKINK